MSDPILSPSEKKRLEQDEKTVMAMAAVFCRGHHHICAQGETLPRMRKGYRLLPGANTTLPP